MLSEFSHLLMILEEGTFTAAAKRAGLTQPALTASIHRLEASFGATLLHRGRRGVELTAAGRAMVPKARAALAAARDARRAVAEIVGLHAGEVRIGAGATACTHLLPPFLVAFRGRHPEIRFRLRESTTDEALVGLDQGDIDIAVVSSSDAEPWMDDELILVAAPRFPLPEIPYHAPFVTFRHGSTHRTLLQKHIPEADVVMELGGIAGVKGNVRAGVGVALLSRAAARSDLQRGDLQEVPCDRTPIARTLGLLHRGHDRLPPAAQAFMDDLRAGSRAAVPP
ncbi:MAG: LysR family transcriptional regulator [Myxococcota bacterium]